MTSPDRIEMELVGDYARKHEYWVKHRRSKNYIARICGTDKKYGYKRVFLDRVRMGRETVYCKDDFTSGVLYEFKSIYYTGSGHPMPEVDGTLRMPAMVCSLFSPSQWHRKRKSIMLIGPEQDTRMYSGALTPTATVMTPLRS